MGAGASAEKVGDNVAPLQQYCTDEFMAKLEETMPEPDEDQFNDLWFFLGSEGFEKGSVMFEEEMGLPAGKLNEALAILPAENLEKLTTGLKAVFDDPTKGGGPYLDRAFRKMTKFMLSKTCAEWEALESDEAACAEIMANWDNNYKEANNALLAKAFARHDTDDSCTLDNSQATIFFENYCTAYVAMCQSQKMLDHFFGEKGEVDAARSAYEALLEEFSGDKQAKCTAAIDLVKGEGDFTLGSLQTWLGDMMKGQEVCAALGVSDMQLKAKMGGAAASAGEGENAEDEGEGENAEDA